MSNEAAFSLHEDVDTQLASEAFNVLPLQESQSLFLEILANLRQWRNFLTRRHIEQHVEGGVPNGRPSSLEALGDPPDGPFLVNFHVFAEQQRVHHIQNAQQVDLKSPRLGLRTEVKVTEGGKRSMSMPQPKSVSTTEGIARKASAVRTSSRSFRLRKRKLSALMSPWIMLTA
jgi:hypothetical protein